MQLNEVRQRVQQIEQTIDRAAQACQSDSSVPEQLKQCINELDQQSGQAKQMMQSGDESRIRQCIDDLEAIGDRARQACEQAGSVSEDVRDAVMQAHTELSQLKHQMH